MNEHQRRMPAPAPGKKEASVRVPRFALGHFFKVSFFFFSFLPTYLSSFTQAQHEVYQYLYNVHYRRYIFSEIYRTFVRSVSQRHDRQRGISGRSAKGVK